MNVKPLIFSDKEDLNQVVTAMLEVERLVSAITNTVLESGCTPYEKGRVCDAVDLITYICLEVLINVATNNLDFPRERFQLSSVQDQYNTLKSSRDEYSEIGYRTGGKLQESGYRTCWEKGGSRGGIG